MSHAPVAPRKTRRADRCKVEGDGVGTTLPQEGAFRKKAQRERFFHGIRREPTNGLAE